VCTPRVSNLFGVFLFCRVPLHFYFVLGRGRTLSLSSISIFSNYMHTVYGTQVENGQRMQMQEAKETERLKGRNSQKVGSAVFLYRKDAATLTCQNFSKVWSRLWRAAWQNSRMIFAPLWRSLHVN
jgi:S-adenosylmethionine:diacylglycerol 3-amino-3-carboxypropyl transferase